METINAGEITLCDDKTRLIIKRKGFPPGILFLEDYCKEPDPDKCLNLAIIFLEDLSDRIGFCSNCRSNKYFTFFDDLNHYYCQWNSLSDLVVQKIDRLPLLMEPDNCESFPQNNPSYSIIKQVICDLIGEEDYNTIIKGLRRYGVTLISEISTHKIDYCNFETNLVYYFLYYPFQIETLYRICKKYQEQFRDLIQEDRIKISIIGAGPAPEIVGISLFFSNLDEKSKPSFFLFDNYGWTHTMHHDIPKKMSEFLGCNPPIYQNYICDFFEIIPNQFDHQGIIANSDCIITSNMILDLMNQKKDESEILGIFSNIIEIMKEASILIISDIPSSDWKTVILLNQFLKKIKDNEMVEVISENVEFGRYKPNFDENNEDYLKIDKIIESWYKLAHKGRGYRRKNTEFCYIIIKKVKGV